MRTAMPDPTTSTAGGAVPRPIHFEIHAADPGGHARLGTWDVFCWVDTLDPLFLELEARGASVVYPPTVQPYGMREFAVRDPTGYVVGFGEEWPTRVAAPIREE
jgi:catechol 2,3-dioxygenase-like lactoylglutathione lyase family enzyme